MLKKSESIVKEMSRGRMRIVIKMIAMVKRSQSILGRSSGMMTKALVPLLSFDLGTF